MRTLCDGYLRKPVLAEDLVRTMMEHLKYTLENDIISVDDDDRDAFTLTAESLNEIEGELLIQLSRAAHIGNINLFISLVKDNLTDYPELSQVLLDLAEGLELETLNSLFDGY